MNANFNRAQFAHLKFRLCRRHFLYCFYVNLRTKHNDRRAHQKPFAFGTKWGVSKCVRVLIVVVLVVASFNNNNNNKFFSCVKSTWIISISLCALAFWLHVYKKNVLNALPLIHEHRLNRVATATMHSNTVKCTYGSFFMMYIKKNLKCMFPLTIFNTSTSWLSIRAF